jgi:hypothetical protein
MISLVRFKRPRSGHDDTQAVFSIPGSLSAVGVPAVTKPFPIILLAVSVSPYFILPLFSNATNPPGIEQTKQALLFFGQVHIALTALMYFDKDFQKIISDNKNRYFYLPLGAAVMFGVSFYIVPQSYQFLLWWFYAGWQNWHFGKQNVGVLSFIAAHDKKSSASQVERWIINGANLCGIVAFTHGMNLADANFRSGFPVWFLTSTVAFTFASYGLWILLCSALLFVFVKRSSMSPSRVLFLLFAVLFFFPIYASKSFTEGFVPVSISHSLQYISFMVVFWFNDTLIPKVNFPSPQGTQTNPALFKATFFLVIAVVGGAILTIRQEFGPLVAHAIGFPTAAPFISGFMFGLVIAHFIIDAHAWRLRDKPQHNFMRERFGFVFS